MKQEYDPSAMKSRKNPYAPLLKKQMTLRLDPDAVAYLIKAQSAEHGIPYQTFINLYLGDCMASHGTLNMTWSS